MSNSSLSICQPLPAERLEKSSLKRASTENGGLKERMTQFRSESSASETEGLMRELKRQKIQPSSTDNNNLVGSCSNLDPKSGKGPGALFPANPDDSHTNIGICSFCQSSRTSEVIFDLHAISGM